MVSVVPVHSYRVMVSASRSSPYRSLVFAVLLSTAPTSCDGLVPQCPTFCQMLCLFKKIDSIRVLSIRINIA